MLARCGAVRFRAMPARKRLTRAESQEQTRRRRLDSALRLCARRGLRDATIEEIAEEAGFSRGAVYALTVVERRLLKGA